MRPDLRRDALDAAAHSQVLRPFVDDLEVVSAARNGQRLDAEVEVEASGRRWWLVRVGDDEPVVFERPAAAPARADESVVVVLNGLSSSGKSSVVRAVVEGSDDRWIGFDEPFFGIVRPEVLIWPEHSPSIWRGFLAGIGALAAEGNRVIAASGGVAFERWREVVGRGGSRLVTVALDCPADVLAERHRRRPDRRGDLIASTTVHDSWTYDRRFDSSVMAPDEIAGALLAMA